MATATGSSTSPVIDAASGSGGSAETGARKVTGVAGRSESSEQEIVLQTINDYGGKMNVGARAHLQQIKLLSDGESVGSGGLPRGSAHVSTIKVDENENELEASANKSEDDQYASGLSLGLDDYTHNTR